MKLTETMIHQMRIELIDPRNQRDSWRMFVGLVEGLGGDDFWRLFHRIFPGLSFVDPVECASLFDRFRADHSEEHMQGLNRQLYAHIPDRLIVHRGQCARKPRRLSWSVSKSIASFYGSSKTHEDPVLYTARVSKWDVVSVFSDAGDKELVLFNPNTLVVAREEIDPAAADQGRRMMEARRVELLQKLAAV
jgi:hypothetical protein